MLCSIVNEENERCEDCGVELKLEVLESAAGFYVGTRCKCGPYSRESGYFKTEKDAKEELDFINGYCMGSSPYPNNEGEID